MRERLRHLNTFLHHLSVIWSQISSFSHHFRTFCVIFAPIMSFTRKPALDPRSSRGQAILNRGRESKGFAFSFIPLDAGSRSGMTIRGTSIQRRHSRARGNPGFCFYFSEFVNMHRT